MQKPLFNELNSVKLTGAHATVELHKAEVANRDFTVNWIRSRLPTCWLSNQDKAEMREKRTLRKEKVEVKTLLDRYLLMTAAELASPTRFCCQEAAGLVIQNLTLSAHKKDGGIKKVSLEIQKRILALLNGKYDFSTLFILLLAFFCSLLVNKPVV